MKVLHPLATLCITILFLIPACAPATPSRPPNQIWQGWTYADEVALQIEPAQAWVDTPLAIRVTGLQPGEPVNLRARMALQGRLLESLATFIAGENGSIVLARAAPLYGPYSQADPMGLFWSLRLVEAETAVGSEPREPVAPLTVTLTAEANDRVLASREIERLFYDPQQVARQPVWEAGLVATLFVPQSSGGSPGPNPAIIWLGGSDGGLAEGYAALLASHGYTTLALAYFGVGPLPAELVEIPLEYFKGAIEWLKTQPSVDPQRIALMGVSKGAVAALLLAATYPQDIQAVVAYKPSSVVWMGMPRNPADSFRGSNSSWHGDKHENPRSRSGDDMLRFY